MDASVNDLNGSWRQQVTAPEYEVMLQELEDLGCTFEWRPDDLGVRFVALRDDEVIAQCVVRKPSSTTGAIHDVLNQAADHMEILA